MSFPRHADYQVSPIEWLDEKPLHWHHTQIQYLLLEGRHGIRIGPFGSSIKLEDMVEDGYKVYGQENVIHRDFTAGKRFLGESKFAELSEYELQSGDVVVTMAGTVGRCQVVPDSIDRGIMDSHLVRMRFKPDKVFPPLIPYLIEKTQYVRDQIIVAGRGTTMAGLNSTIIKKLEVVLPAPDEQRTIVAFLDTETSKIDGLVSEQRRLIELLKEKRQAVISHAVTKGLNPDVKMKPSGIQWLGEVPEHWEVASLKHYVSTANGFGFSSSDFQDDGVPFIRAGDIKNKSIRPPTIFLPKEVVANYERVILTAGDIVISMVGSDPKIIESAVGQVGIIPEHLAGAVPNQNIVIMRESSDFILSRYLFYTLCSTAYRNHLNVFSHKLANQSIISSSLLIAATFTFPHKKEQQAIVDVLDETVAATNQLIAQAERAIELLQERRTALISAAVTGKIDVREYVAEEVAA